MDCEDPHHREITDLINSHPFLPTEELRFRIIELAEMHLRHEDEDIPPIIEVTPCVLIAMIRELLTYRKKHGLIGAVTQDWQFDAHKPVN